MRVQVVQARVSPEGRARYLAAWSEWSGTLYTMGMRAELLEAEERRGEFLELTWLEDDHVAALADDRLVGIQAELDAAAESREGALRLHRRHRSGER